MSFSVFVHSLQYRGESWNLKAKISMVLDSSGKNIIIMESCILPRLIVFNQLSSFMH